jgi:hypothetical protein
VDGAFAQSSRDLEREPAGKKVAYSHSQRNNKSSSAVRFAAPVVAE